MSEAIDLMSECVQGSIRKLGKEHPDKVDRDGTLKAWLDKMDENYVDSSSLGILCACRTLKDFDRIFSLMQLLSIRFMLALWP